MNRLSRFALWQGTPYLLAFAILLSAALLVRLAMPFEFPIPWPDETLFISPAHAFSTDGTFFVDALNAERVVMWMPPGYMLLLAGVFDVFGYSFDTARWVSTVCWLAGVLLGLVLIRQLELPRRYLWWALAGTVLTFLSPYLLANSNIARMEALYTALFLASLFAMVKGRPGVGLALVLASAVVHFNAVYMLLPYAVLVLWIIFSRQPLVLRASELLALLLAFAVLAAYALMVAANLNGFIEDMTFQFRFKHSLGPTMGGATGWLKLGLTLLLALGQLVGTRRFGKDVMLSLYGAAFMALALHGQSMWYDFSFVVADWLLLLSVLVSASYVSKPWLHRGILLLAVGFSVVLLTHGYSKREHFSALWPRAELFQRSFIEPSEIERIRNWIGTLPRGTRVSFGLSGVEPFIFDEAYQAGVVWSLTRHNVIEVFPLRKDDFRVVCDSSLYPKLLLRLFDFDISTPRQGKDVGCRIETRTPDLKSN